MSDSLFAPPRKPRPIDLQRFDSSVGALSKELRALGGAIDLERSRSKSILVDSPKVRAMNKKYGRLERELRRLRGY
jgi:hypothetical protein